jgi:hypothetical protein
MTAVETFQIGLPQEILFAGDENFAGLLLGGYMIGLLAPIAMFPPATTSGYEVASDLEVPAGAVVDRAVVRVAAAAPNRTGISGVATVRVAAGTGDGPSNAMIVDFGVMRNVSNVEGPVSMTRIAPWLGTSFDSDGYGAGGTDVALTELQTERLLIEFDEPVTPDEVAAGHVTTSTAPADLDLFVAGSRVWFHQGSVPSGFAEEVDITAVVQEAVSAGISPVPVVLRTRVPGHLELSPVGTVKFLRTHVVQFVDGGSTIVDAPEEGIVDVPLSLPPESGNWTIHRVVATVTGSDPGPDRVLPPIGPEALADAELTLNADRRLVVRIPEAALTPLRTLTAVRVRLQVGSGGVGVVGGLLDGTSVEPGRAVPGGEITEVSLLPGDVASWVTLAFAKPQELRPSQPLWLSIAATRGSAILGLRNVGGLVGSDEDLGIAVIRRIAANGVPRPLSAPVGLRTDALAIRLVGRAPDDRPIDLVTVGLASTADDPQGVVARDLASDAELSDTPSRFVRALPEPQLVDGLTLRAIVTAATRLTVGPVVIAYEEREGV